MRVPKQASTQKVGSRGYKEWSCVEKLLERSTSYVVGTVRVPNQASTQVATREVSWQWTEGGQDARGMMLPHSSVKCQQEDSGKVQGLG